LLDFFDGVKPNEDNERKVGVQRVGGEQGNEADRPSESGVTAVHFEGGQDGKDQKGEDVNEDFHGRTTGQSSYFLQSEEHLDVNDAF